MNLRDITTQSHPNDKNAVFAFDIHPRISPILALGYRVQIQWSQRGIEFGSYNGNHTFYHPPEGPENCRGTLSNTTLELVGAGSYKLKVPIAVIDSGPLSISVSVSLTCLNFSSNSCPACSQWRYTSQTNNSIDISAKKGRTTHTAARTHVCDMALYTALLYSTHAWDSAALL